MDGRRDKHSSKKIRPEAFDDNPDFIYAVTSFFSVEVSSSNIFTASLKKKIF